MVKVKLQVSVSNEVRRKIMDLWEKERQKARDNDAVEPNQSQFVEILLKKGIKAHCSS